MAESPVRIRSSGYPVELPIDGQLVRAMVRRFTIDQLSRFVMGYQRIEDPHSARLVSMRYPGEEQARDPDRAYLIDDEEIRRRRLVEMPAEQRAEYEHLREQEDLDAAAFIAQQLAAHLTIQPGQIVEEDDDGVTREVTSGAEFARIYGGRRDVLSLALTAIRVENTLSETTKNALRSPRDSASSSGAREPDASAADPGPRPADPVAPVEHETSATNGTATASHVAMSPSGAMALVTM